MDTAIVWAIVAILYTTITLMAGLLVALLNRSSVKELVAPVCTMLIVISFIAVIVGIGLVAAEFNYQLKYGTLAGSTAIILFGSLGAYAWIVRRIGDDLP